MISFEMIREIMCGLILREAMIHQNLLEPPHITYKGCMWLSRREISWIGIPNKNKREFRSWYLGDCWIQN